MHRLKHTFIIAVCLILLLNVMPTAFANSTDSANGLSHNDYSQALSEMIEYYEPIYGGFTTDENGIHEPIKTNRLIVKTNSNEPISDALGAVAKIEGYNEIHILQYSNSTSAEAAYNYFNTQDSIKYVEYDMYFCISEDEVSATEDVPDSGEHLSWGNSAIKSDIVNQMLISSNIELNEVIVAVFDSGLDDEHKRIDKSRICTGRNTWDAENPTDLVDYYEHGTKVAGIILDNTLPNVKIKPYKVSNWYGGIYYSQMVDAIPVAVEDGVDVINMSFSYPGMDYKLFQENVNAAVNEGVSFVVASGNDNKNANGYYPSLFDSVITVSAIDSNFIPWEDSNWGSCVDVSAPGADIISLDAFDDIMKKPESGTSAAAPFVTAAVAILKSIDSSLTPNEIKTRITSSAFVPESWDSSKYGTGVLDCESMISDMLTDRPKIILSSDSATITSTKNAKIYYTIDGSNPIVGVSDIYTEPISTSNIKKIKAIAYEDGKLPSIVVASEIRRTKNITMRYMGTEKLELNPGEKIGAVYVANEDVITYEEYGKIKAHSIGETQVIAFIGNNRRITYNVTVEFAWWQFPHKIFYEWFGILLWSF